MLTHLLAFFEGENQAQQGGESGWLVYVLGGVLLVIMVLTLIIPQRRQKKRQEEMMSKLELGCIVTTYSGVVGEVVEIDDKHIWLLTGTNDQKSTLQLVRQAILSIAPAPGSPEAVAEEKTTKESDEIDEIK